MTAEIAVLNKSAVALATDSAVTISNGQQAIKIFESADKLFELSTNQPIGIMIYNEMQFLGVPLETVIKGFRLETSNFETVQDAANCFLGHLYKYVDGAPDNELLKSVSTVIAPIAREIDSAIKSKLFEFMQNIPEDITNIEELQTRRKVIIEDVLKDYEDRVSSLGEADFIPRSDRKSQPKRYKDLVRKAVEIAVPSVEPEMFKRVSELCEQVLASRYVSEGRTGMVFAGFGENEVFPTLISFEIDSIYQAKIRAFETDHCDIDRDGLRAYVRPFAQKEMVDRFLHGLDDRLRSDITEFCTQAVSKISIGLIESLEISDPERDALQKLAADAEKAFIHQLNVDAFTSFQQRSRSEIENMVEFMPKPELAKMAEALIDLTSIKRKVSQELETVGGPVDVAVISKNDGFVWVKRKHYFPSELNSRYFKRNSDAAQRQEDDTHE